MKKAILSVIVVLLLAESALAAVSATISISNTIGTVGPGVAITVSCSVKNTGTTTQTFGVGGEVLQGATFKGDMGQKTTTTLSPGASGTVMFTYTIPTSWSDGTYTAHVVVWSGTPGSSTWLNEASQNFTVQTIISATITISNTIGTVGAGN
jgi:uncharacterized membrane protein